MIIGRVGGFDVYATVDRIGLDAEDRDKTLTPEEACQLADCLRGWGKAAKGFAKIRKQVKP